MAKTRSEKAEHLKEVQVLLSEAVNGSVAFVKFDKLTVTEVTALRRKLREDKVKYAVVKKSIAAKALSETKTAGEMPELLGQVGFAWSEDQIAPARNIYEFQKKFENKVELVGGIFEGKYMNKAEMLSIAMIPSRQTLYAQFVNLINSPIQGLAMVIDGIAKKKEAGATV